MFLSFVVTIKLSIDLLPFTAKVVTDRVSGYSKGFGFVRYSTLEDAAKGIEGMDGKVS
jgi:RNA recognition motif-containing protein